MDLKKTLKKAKLSQYRLAKDLGIATQQVNRWYLGHNKIGRLWQEKLTEYFNEKNIAIVLTNK